MEVGANWISDQPFSSWELAFWEPWTKSIEGVGLGRVGFGEID